MASVLDRYPAIPALYLLGVSLLAFFIPRSIVIPGLAILFIIQYGLLVYKREFSSTSFRIYSRLKFLFFFLVLISALFPESPSVNEWSFFGVSFSPEGAASGLIMCAQIALVVLTSYVVRSLGDTETFVRGLRSLRVPLLLSHSLDTTLVLLSSEDSHGRGGGRGHGRGGGGGRNHAGQHQQIGSLREFLKSARNADLSPLYRKIGQSLSRSRSEIERRGISSDIAHDVSVISGIALVMLSFKFIKILPGISYFSGGKAIFFFPLYLVAAELTRSRWGATVAGTVMGVIAFLNGDGRYGVFEIFKHVAPGLLMDLLWPVVKKVPLSLWVTCSLGVLAAIARTSTELLMVFFLGADSAELYLFPAMRLAPNLIAGFVSGFLSAPVLRAVRAGKIQVEDFEHKEGVPDDRDNEDGRGTQTACA